MDSYYFNNIISVFTDLDFKDIGLAYPNINTKTLGNIITYSIFVIAILYLLSILYYFIAYHSSDKFRTKFIQAKEEQLNTVSFSDIIPVTGKEKKTMELCFINSRSHRRDYI